MAKFVNTGQDNWHRKEGDGKLVVVFSPHDHSPVHNIPDDGHADCPCCQIGLTHSEEYHSFLLG